MDFKEKRNLLSSKKIVYNILEYAQILVTGGKFTIFDIEGHSSVK